MKYLFVSYEEDRDWCVEETVQWESYLFTTTDLFLDLVLLSIRSNSINGYTFNLQGCRRIKTYIEILSLLFHLWNLFSFNKNEIFKYSSEESLLIYMQALPGITGKKRLYTSTGVLI